ncbi:MAG: hypothetical protein NTZ02_03350 [Candidatus Woesearchaeota archaeon]|nr:hypothetical protein [Candidatus Woesearchaeota archaeon]
MGWNFGLFKRKSEESKEISAVEKVETSVSLSFSRLKADIEKIGLWIRYFAEEAIMNRQEHSLVRGELSSQHSEISELRKNQHSMISALEKNAVIISELSKKIKNTENALSENNKNLPGKFLEQEIPKEFLCKIEQENQLGTCPGTSTGQVRDKSTEKLKTFSREARAQKIEKLEYEQEMSEDSGAHFDRSMFLPSELEVIKTLYYSERPIGYAEIAKLLGKSGKSIRNIICDARKKGIEILDKPIGIRDKGFYLSGKAKVLVSGR